MAYRRAAVKSATRNCATPVKSASSMKSTTRDCATVKSSTSAVKTAAPTTPACR